MQGRRIELNTAMGFSVVLFALETLRMKIGQVSADSEDSLELRCIDGEVVSSPSLRLRADYPEPGLKNDTAHKRVQ